jgi:hypothetical protein
MRLSNKRLKVFSGNANKELAEDICQCLGLDLGLGELLRFKDGEIFFSHYFYPPVPVSRSCFRAFYNTIPIASVISLAVLPSRLATIAINSVRSYFASWIPR